MGEIFRAEDVYVKRGENLVLKGFNLAVGEGEKLLLLGPNGSGKTTFFEVVVGFVKPERGRLLFMGKPVEAESDFRLLRRKVGYVFQDPESQILMPTVEEEIAFGLLNLGMPRSKIREEVEMVLSAFGISHLKRKFTHELSWGEKRLLSIASIAVMKPELFLLDEPFAGLDERGVRIVASFLKEYDKAVILASHTELNFFEDWDKFYLRTD